MRILYLVNAIDSDQLGGMQRYTVGLAQALSVRGHDVTIATKRLSRDLPPEETLASGPRLLRLHVPSRDRRSYAILYPLALAAGAASLLSKEHFDVVHAGFPFQAFGARLARVPYLYTF